jgi:succinoglycan biosynthesis transport protein ExoP
MEKSVDFNDIKNIIKKRKKAFLILFFLCLSLGFTVAVSLPPIYKSDVMIKIDDQVVSESFAQPTVSEYVEERIGKISQQILNRSKLEEIVYKYNLYSADKNTTDISEVIEKFREDINLETVVSEMQSKPGGKQLSFTTALTLSYEGRDPYIVQEIANTLANFYIEEDNKNTERIVSENINFLKLEQERLKKGIEIQEKVISDFKEKHSRELPQDIGYNLGAIARYERDYEQAEMKLRSLNERKIFLQAQLDGVDPLTPIVVEGEKISTNPSQRLKELNLQLSMLKSIYSKKHPDIKKLNSEISELESQVSISDISVEKIKRLRNLENKLAELEGKYSSEHPEVKALKKEIATLRKEVKYIGPETAKLKISEEKPDNPAYIKLVTELNTVNIEIQSLEEEKKRAIKAIDKYQGKIARTPTIEKELNAITRDYEGSKKKYDEIYSQLMSAQVAKQIDDKKQGSRFSIASNAYLPTKPYKPNRLGIILISSIIALGVSSFFIAICETMDNTLRSQQQISKIIGAPVFSTLSFIETTQEKAFRYVRYSVVILIIFSIAGLVLYGIDRHIVKLPELLSILVERIKMFT